MLSHKRTWISPRKWLCKFSGEDFQLIHDAKTDVRVKSKFAAIGFLVLFIFFIAFCSSAHFIYHLFNGNLYMAAPVGIVWGLMIVNIYLLLLYTITPAMLKGRDRAIRGILPKLVKDYKWLNIISLSFRIGFILLIAIIIAQPWLVITFSPFIGNQLEQYKQQYRNEFVIQADSLLILQETKLAKDMKQQISLKGNNSQDSLLMVGFGRSVSLKIKEDEYFLDSASSVKAQVAILKARGGTGTARQITNLEDKLTSLVVGEMNADSLFVLQTRSMPVTGDPIINLIRDADLKLMAIINTKNNHYKKLNTLLTANNFYVRKIQMINSRYPLSWLMTLLVIMVFILPILWKYRVRNESNFYDVKKNLEIKIVLEEYSSFTKAYSKIFDSVFDVRVAYYESCIDPPFNTRKKDQNAQYKDQNLLLNEIYSDPQDAEENKYLVSEIIS